VEARIGSGGMGEVFRAHDAVLDREVAIKVLHRQLAGDTGFVERFRREARAAAGLSHPNIVAVHDWGGRRHLLHGHGVRPRAERSRDPERRGPACAGPGGRGVAADLVVVGAVHGVEVRGGRAAALGRACAEPGGPHTGPRRVGERSRALPRPRARHRRSAGARRTLAVRHHGRRARPDREPASAHPPRAGRHGAAGVRHRRRVVARHGPGARAEVPRAWLGGAQLRARVRARRMRLSPANSTLTAKDARDAKEDQPKEMFAEAICACKWSSLWLESI